MPYTADTNVLVRIVMQDDAKQAATARALFLQATVIAIPVPVFCEFAWILKRGYAASVNDIASAIEAIVKVDAVVTDLPAVEAGLTALPTVPSLIKVKRLAGPCSRVSIATQSLFCETTERKRPTQQN